jgi:AcrR family transcriptional regulator
MATNHQTKSMSSRRQRNRERMIQTILETACDIMREHGVAGLTIHGLTRCLEMQPPSLSNYFSGLMDIYDALFRMGFTMWGNMSVTTFKVLRSGSRRFSWQWRPI